MTGTAGAAHYFFVVGAGLFLSLALVVSISQFKSNLRKGRE